MAINNINSIDFLISYNRKIIKETINEASAFPTFTELQRVVLAENEIRNLQARKVEELERLWAV